MFIKSDPECSGSDLANRFVIDVKRILFRNYSFNSVYPVLSCLSCQKKFKISLVRIMKLKMIRAGDSYHAFTLIELLVVIAIITILMGLIIPGYQSARENAKRSKAKATVKNLETAFKEYLNHYKVWPSDVSSEGEMKLDAGNNLYKILRGDSGSGNPDGIAFFEFEAVPDGATADTACDPWKYDPDGNEDWQVYRVKFDKNYNNEIGSEGIYRSVIVWSVGPDRDSDTDDDIKSWE